MKDLAVLIPTYNDQKALLTALDSIQEEDHSFTVVVVDDGSTPPAEVDANAYPFTVKLIRQPQNGGIVKALNRGLEYIRENDFLYMARLDSGDLNRPNRFAIQYQRLASSENLAMTGTNTVFCNESTGEGFFQTNLPLETREIRKWTVFRTCFIHPTVMMRMDRIPEGLVYTSRYPHMEDYVFFTEIAENCETENLPDPLTDCFVRDGGLSRKNDRAQLMSGIRHHLDHPRPLNHLWYAYLAKKLAYLIVPWSLRSKIKGALRFTKTPADKPVEQTV